MKKIIISTLLFALGIFLSCIYFLNSDINPNVITHNHFDNASMQSAGQIRGEFTASDNYLGILTVRFDNEEIIEGKSVFRIKEKMNTDWYYASIIDAIQYSSKPSYPFGFPIIKDSKNKTYEFEIFIPNYIRVGPPLRLNINEPIITSHYVFPWKTLLSDKRVLLDFIKQKMSYQLQSPSAPWVLLTYIFPLIGYLLYKSPFILNVRPIAVITLIGIGFDVFILRNHYNPLALILSLAWMGGIFFHGTKAQTSILIAMILLMWSPFFLITHMVWVAEKATNWMFILSTIGFFQYIVNIVTPDEK